MLIKLVCPNCGAPMDVDDSKSVIFCSNCGTKMLNQQEVVQIQQHVVVEHKTEKDPHTLIVNYTASDMNVKLVVLVRAVRRKDVLISGQTMKYILAPGQYVIVLKIGKINYNRTIVVPKDGTPVEIHASWAGRANISIDQPLYDPSEIEVPKSQSTASPAKETSVKESPAPQKPVVISKPYSERTYFERVFRKGMIAPWIIFGFLVFMTLGMFTASVGAALIMLLATILMCPLTIELICKFLPLESNRAVKVVTFIMVGVLFFVSIMIDARQNPPEERSEQVESSTGAEVQE